MKHWFIHGLGLFPLIILFQDLGSVNPIQALTQHSGLSALGLLLASLACSPLHLLTGYKPALAWRRPLGLYGFGYVALHLVIFAFVDFGLDLNLIGREIVEKRYIVVGFLAFLCLLPLAITSTKGWQRRLGKRWKVLHRLVYLAVPLAILHYLWAVKADYRLPLALALILALLLVLRLPPIRRWWLARRASPKLAPEK